MSSTISARAVRSSMKLWGMRPAMRADSTVGSTKNRDGHQYAEKQGPNGSADHERQSLARKAPELTTFGFDLSTDGDADQRDEDQRTGGGNTSAAEHRFSRRA